MNMLTRLNRANPFLTLRGVDDLLHSVLGRLQEYTPELFLENGGPRFEVEVREDDVKARLPLAGFKPEDVEISAAGDTLTVVARREEVLPEGNARYLRRERRREAVEESVRFPVEVRADEAVASYRDGILEVTLPRETAKRNRNHTIKVNGR